MPVSAYRLVGFWAVDVFPSPKSQLYEFAPADRLVKLTVNGGVPNAGVKLKSTAGNSRTSTVSVTELLQPAEEATVKFIWKKPVSEKAKRGFCTVEAPVPPKSQYHDVIM